METQPEKETKSLLKKILKGIGIFLGSVLGLALLAFLIYYVYGYSQFHKTYDITPEKITVSTDEASIARGKLLVRFVRCTECHQEDLSGVVWIDQFMMGHWGPSNLTPGKGSSIANYTDEDFVRAIRHGINPDGKPLVYMPAQFYIPMGEQDLADIIAYIRSLPPVDTERGQNTTGPILWYYALTDPTGAGLPVKQIDHSEPFPQVPERGATIEYGSYMAEPCRNCHGEDLAGRERLERLGVPSPNITPIGLETWSEEDFFTAMKTGLTPDGRTLSPDTMPWEVVGQFGDDEIQAIWLYIQSVPSVTNERIVKGNQK